MKKVLKSLALIAAAAMTLASCQNELQPEVTPGTVVSKGTVHVEFGATSNEPQTKVTLGTSDDIKFEADWISGTDKLWIDYVWETEDDLGDTAVLSDAWNGNSFEADLVGPKGIENQDLPAHWVYTCYYPQPRIVSNNHYFAFGANRDQDGSNYAGQYDLMYGGAETTNSVAGKDGDNKVVFKMDRLTSIAYFHITTSGFDASEKLAKAVLEITEADDNIIACDEVYYVDGAIYKNGANQSSSITLNTTQAMDDIKLWYNVIPLTFRKATLTLTTDKGKYITLNMGDGVKEFAYMPGELQKAKIGTIPSSAFTDPTPAEAFYTLTFTKNGGNTSYSSSHTETVGEVTWTVFGNSSLGADLRVGGKNLSSTDRTLTSGSQFAESINKVVINHSGKYSKSGSSITVNSVSAILSTASNFASGTIVEQQTISSPSVSSAGAIEINFDDAHEDCYVRIVVNATTTGSDNSYLIINSVELFEGNAKDKFAINIQSVTGGSITANKTTASEGTVITLVPVPNGDYDFTSWAVTNANTSASIEVVNNQFIMPAAPVNVSAVFTKKPYKVTYDKNTTDDTFDGTLPVDSNNYTDSSNEVTVLGATLTRTDYNFVGWNTQADGEGTDYVAGDKFTITANTTLYAKWEEKTYTVTLVPPTNGSYVIKDANDNPLNDGNYASFEVTNGTVLKYTYSPADGYKFRNWQVNDGTTHTYTSNLSYTINRKDITIEGNFDKIDYKKVYFSVNGTVQNPDGTAVEVGTVINFPADPSAIDGHPFMGWSATTVSSQSTAPTMVNKTNTKMGANDVTYYAVFGEGMAATFAASDITNTPAVAGEELSWKDSETNIKLHLSAGSRYTSGTPNTFTVTGGKSNYFEITAPATLSKIVTVVSTTTYKIGSVSTGASLASSSTTQTITFTSAMNSVKCYATTSQIRATSITVECISSYSTSVKTLDHITVTGDVTNKSYTAGQSLNPAGLVVTAYYTDSTNEPVSPQGWSFDPATLSVGTTSCTATADYGGKTASKEISGLTVNEVEPQAPSFTTQPSASATYSQNATATALNVEATGNPRPSLQWYSNSTNSNAGGSAIQGATGASYTPSTTTVGTTYYYCIATNSEGSAASNVSKIEVTGGAQTGTLETMATSGDIVKDIITFKTAKNSGTSAPAVNSGQLRLYQCSSADVSKGTRGGSITIEASSGHKIKKITITNANSNDCDGGTVAYQVNGAGSWSGSATVNKNTTYSTGDNLDASSVEIACFGTTKSNRLYITKIKVEYY